MNSKRKMTTNAEEEWLTRLQRKTISWCMVPISKAPPLFNTSTGMSRRFPPTSRGWLTQTEERSSQSLAGTQAGKETEESRPLCQFIPGKREKKELLFVLWLFTICNLQNKFTNTGRPVAVNWCEITKVKVGDGGGRRTCQKSWNKKTNAVTFETP